MKADFKILEWNEYRGFRYEADQNGRVCIFDRTAQYLTAVETTRDADAFVDALLFTEHHAYENYVVALATCDCCESEVTEVCGECNASVTLCQYCHGHREFDSADCKPAAACFLCWTEGMTRG